MEENKSITISRIFYVAFRRWKLFLPVAVGVALLSSLAILLLYNPYKANYVATFTYTSMDLQQNKYADGSSFSYGNLVSLDNLTAIKNSDEKYASIDVDSLVSKDKIKISREYEKDNNNQETGTYTYTLEMNKKYFSKLDIASSFAYDIAYSAIKEDQRKVDNFNIGESVATFDSQSTFEGQINALANQSNTLSMLYKTYTEPTNVETVYPPILYSLALEHKQNLEANFSSGHATTLKAKISEYGFVKDYSVADYSDLDAARAPLLQEKADNEAVLKVYTDQIAAMQGGSALTELPSFVEDLTKRNSEIATELISVTAKVNNKPLYDSKDVDYMNKYNAFVAELESAKQTVIKETDNYKTFLTKAYIVSGAVDFENTAVVEQKGNVNAIIAVVISVLLGVITGAIVNLIVDRKKLYE